MTSTKTKWWKTLALLVVGTSISFAAEPLCAASEADAAYQHGDYAQAIVRYTECYEQNVNSADMAYNLGNAYFRADSLGKAILFYQKAQRLAPGNDDIRANLRFAESRRMDKVGENSDENPLLHALLTLHHALDIDTQWKLLLTLAWLISVAGISAIWSTPGRRKQWSLVGVVLLVVIALPGLASAAYKLWIFETHSLGVVIARSADVYSGPGKQYQVLNELHEGTSFEVREVQDGWVSIRVDDRIGGFLPIAQVGLVEESHSSGH